MPRAPTNIRQAAAIRAFLRAGGVLRQGKGSHQVVKMPNGKIISLPHGILKQGLLEAEIRKSGLTIEEFLELL
jgi:predicted RNA binding protein YcfA (HicA-like mRNA interferase family)